MSGKNINLIYSGSKARGVRLPLSILSLADPLVNKGYNVKLYDIRVEDFPVDEANDALLTGFSVWTGHHSIPHAIDLSKEIKRRFPSVPIVWGGPHPTTLPEETCNNEFVDFVVRKEGEGILLNLVEYLMNGSDDFHEIEGITFKKNGRIVSTPDAKLPKIDKVNHLPYELLKLDKYPNLHNFFDYISSRGCPHNCKFCSEPFLLKRRWRAKSPRTMIEELKYIDTQFHPKRLMINDSNFFVNKKRVIEFCKLKVENNLEFEMTSDCRFDNFIEFDDALLNLLKESGFNEILFGGESGSDRVLQFIGKNISRQEILKGIKTAKKSSIRPIISFMVGFPGESKEDVNKTIRIHEEIKNIYKESLLNGLFIWTPYPGTELYEYVKKEHNFNPPKTLIEWSRYNLYDTNNITWFTEKEKDEIKTLSTIVRYRFVIDLLMWRWSFKEKIARHHTIFHLIFSVLFNLLFFPSALLRWKFRFFKYGFEWKFWLFILENYTGKK